MNLFYAITLAVIGQVLTFLQLQGSAKWGWYDDYPWLILFSSVPIGWCFIKSVNYFISSFNGEIWPSRLIGFGIGVIVFTIMSILLFRESFSIKTLSCLMLSLCIILIQVYWK